eukprot:TRINITY_DN12125_c0_g1_i1.p1 TRINITY_DN12125_c0_g1~~TRINITY_DN12125_c0_g1_i1.p1  ORF type:complete len:347 (-),score=82.65 TRINITY_DN12125_c0_g1_i1:72-1112(-)
MTDDAGLGLFGAGRERSPSIDPLEGMLAGLQKRAAPSASARFAAGVRSPERERRRSTSQGHSDEAENLSSGLPPLGRGRQPAASEEDDETMVVTSSGEGSDPESQSGGFRPSAGVLQRQMQRGRHSLSSVHSAGATRGRAAAALVRSKDDAAAEGASKAAAGAEAMRPSRSAHAADEARLRHARALGALHALRPSELAFLLSGWQAEWLLGQEDLCPTAALKQMLRFQARRRPRRQRGSERIGGGGGRSAAAAAARVPASEPTAVPLVMRGMVPTPPPALTHIPTLSAETAPAASPPAGGSSPLAATPPAAADVSHGPDHLAGVHAKALASGHSQLWEWQNTFSSG